MFHAVYLSGGKIKQFEPINCHECVYIYSIGAFRGRDLGEKRSTCPPLTLQPGSLASTHCPTWSLETQIC